MKILASDYDNTLYVQNKDVFQKNIELVNEFIKRENKFIIITGRSYQGIKNDLIENNIPYDYLICNDGAKIFDKYDNVLKTEVLSEEKIYICQKILKEENIESYLEDGLKKINTTNNCIKVVGIFNDKTKAEKIVERIKEEANVYAYLSTEHINIIESHVNKCHGLAELLKQENLSSENLFVIGDEINDYEMLSKFKGATMSEHSEVLDELNLKEYETLYECIEELL